MNVNWVYLLPSAFAGGAFGAAIGTVSAFAFTGFMVIAGELANLVGDVVAADPSLPITGSLAFGPVFGPHISFAGGAAATAYARPGRATWTRGTTSIWPRTSPLLMAQR